ncbi:MAG: hypothetical protein E6J81_04580, partial [Deltaproteobacteria bacterium]
GGQLEWLRQRLLELAHERNRFLRHMSHELKTPLANIREGTELLMDGAVGDVTHSAVAAAYAERTIELLDGRIVRDIRTSRPLTDGEGAAPVDGSRRPPI